MTTMMIVLAAAYSHPRTISCGPRGDGQVAVSRGAATSIMVGKVADPSAPPNRHCAVLNPGTVSDDTVIRVAAIGKAPSHLKGARARLMARRGGEVVAMARIAEAIGAPRGALLTGVRFVGYEDRSDGSCVVTAELRIR